MSPRPIKKVTPPARAARRAPGWLGACIVGWVAFAIYLPTLRAGFVWDDHFIVTANREIRSLTDLPALLGSHAFSGADAALGSERVVEYYRPVWTASLAVDHALWGLRPFGYHLTNLLLHAAASIAVFLLVSALLGGFLAPFVAGLLFALHPAHVEAVAWVSSRNELVAGLFVALALLAYVRLRRAGGAGGSRASSAGAGARPMRATILSLPSAPPPLLSKETAGARPLPAGAVARLP